MFIRILPLGAALLLLAACASAPQPQLQTQTSPQPQLQSKHEVSTGGWIVICPGGRAKTKSCGLELKMTDEATWLKAYTTYEGPRGLQIAFAIPPQAAVGKSIGISYDGRSRGLVYLTRCTATKCIAMWNLPKVERDRLFRSSLLEIQFHTSPTEGIEFSLPVGDLKEALVRLNKLRSNG